MTRLAAAALLAAALAASTVCGGYRLGPPAPEPAIVSGTVRLVPCRPVERPGDPPCSPAAGVLVEFAPSAGGSPVSATTDSSGSYSVSLAAGTYDARLKRSLVAKPVRFNVAAGERKQLDLVFDSGIR